MWELKVMAATINDFRRAITEQLSEKNLKVELWRDATRRSPHLLEINTKPQPIILYVKVSNSKRGFWGLTKNHIDRLYNSQIQWFAVLLARSTDCGYIFTREEVKNRVDEGIFEFSRDGDYKINENTDCEPKQAFQQLNELFDKIL
jgi:hypothetical protein